MIRRIFSCVSKIITDHEQVIKDIKSEKKLNNYFIKTNLAILICTVIYGAVLGTYVGGYQVFINSIKIPILFFVTLYISLPVFFILDLLLGSKIKLYQMSVLLVTGYAIASIIMIAFTPVVLFFILTAKEYYFTVFLTIGILGFSGYFGIIYIYKNFRLFHKDNKRWFPSVLVGCFIIALVGTQLSWTLRPFFHTHEQFIRPTQGNFYVEIANGIAEHPYIAGPLLFFFLIIAFLVTLIFIARTCKVVPKPDQQISITPSQFPIPPYPQYPFYPHTNPEIQKRTDEVSRLKTEKDAISPSTMAD